MQSYRINCTDKIDVVLQEQQVKITVERTLTLEPKEMFDLSVSYGAVLKFNENKKDEHKMNFRKMVSLYLEIS